MIIDVLVVLLVISAVFRGREIGFIQQLFSTIGFFGGLIAGAALQSYTVTLVEGQLNKSLITVLTTLGIAFLCLAAGEFIGMTIKRRVRMGKLNHLDNGLGSGIAVVTLLLAVWLSATVVKTLPFYGLQDQVRESRVASTLSQRLPYAPDIIAGLGHLINPNGFPQVFIGGDRGAPGVINLPPSSELATAVNETRDSVVKIVGQGCGGVVDGSGFVAGSDLVITNAHVVAGIKRPYVNDKNGTHSASVIWFDSKLDLAILRTANLAGEPLVLREENVANNTAAAVLGYPGGGAFTANPARILDQFIANGRDIYGRGNSQRSVYEVGGTVKPGNSGGPVIDAEGKVIGVVFARSTTYNDVGYALTMDQVASALDSASAQNTTVGTGSCTE
jgi:S1-C subfamily serine protease